MDIALFFGSFNPVHIGHLAIANYIVEYSNVQQLWFVLSPQNPLKNKNSLLPDYQRLELLNRAISDYSKFQVSNIEFNLPKPSYTCNTLVYLHEKFPQHNFYLVMGADNIASFHKWKNYEQILKNNNIIVYPRPNINAFKNAFCKHDNVQIIEAPIMEISSSFIRKAIKESKDIRFFVPKKTYEYIEEMSFYK